METTSRSTLPSNTYHNFGSQGDLNRSTNYGTYDSGIGSLTTHPYQYQTNNHGQNPKDHHQSSYPAEQSQPIVTNNKQKLNSQATKTIEKAQTMNTKNPNAIKYGTTKTIQLPPKKSLDNKYGATKNHQQKSYPEITQPRPAIPVNNQPHLIRSERQISTRPSKHQQNKSQLPPQSNLHRSDPQIFKRQASPPPAPSSLNHESSFDDHINSSFEKTRKKNPSPPDLRPTKSSSMRAAANKKQEENRAQKRKNQFFPEKLKSQPVSPQTDVEQSDFEKMKREQNHSRSLSKTQKSSHSDGEQTDTDKINRNKKKSHSHPRQHKNHRDDYQTEDNNSSNDDDSNPNKHQQSIPKKRTTVPDPHLNKHPHLPPLRQSRVAPYYDPYLDYTLPPGHSLRGRYPYDDYPPYPPYPASHSRRHLYEDAQNIPPYLPAYHDPYDPFFDYKKRKAQPNHHEDHNNGVAGHETDRDDGTKSQASRKNKHKKPSNDKDGRKSRHDLEEIRRSHWPAGYIPPHYFESDDMLEVWRQERNNYLKKKFKPTIHDVLYSQQWMKSDSYLENQRRRALRDAQGYYFPYKKYTLKDYKDMQKLNNQNPFSDFQEIPIDRKERAKKRQEYGSLVERQMVDNPGTRHIPPREMPPRKPWHLKSSEAHNPNAVSRRERALEYAKVQVKYRPVALMKHYSDKSDRTDQSVDNLFSEVNGYRSNTEGTDTIHQSYDA